MSEIHSPQSVSRSSAPQAQSHGASKSDHAMYAAMLAMLSGIGTSESINESMATLSQTLYDTMVKNGTERIQELQSELEDSNFLEENWSAFQNYANWQVQHQQWQDGIDETEAEIARVKASTMDPVSKQRELNELEQGLVYQKNHEPQAPALPPLPPGASAADLQKYLNIVSQYSTVDNYRASQNAIAQQINVANTDVQNNKAIPDAMQAEMMQLTNAQGEFDSEVASFLRLNQDQLLSFR